MTLQHQLPTDDAGVLGRLLGPLDDHLRTIEAQCGVRLSRRGSLVRIEGPAAACRRAATVLEAAGDWAIRGRFGAEQLELLLASTAAAAAARGRGGKAKAPAAAEPGESTEGLAAGLASQPVLHTRRADLQARTPNQLAYLRNILGHDITFGVGPAGTGKTFLAVACAVDALERSQVQRIVLTRPAVEAGERLGFLPGDLSQKVDPYLRPLYDALYDLMGLDRVTRAFEKGLLEIAPLAFMRGRTLNHAFVILDEAQNTTPEQMKMFLTRIGFGAKAVITGDVSQIDLPRGTVSGLIDARRILSRVPGIGFTEFTSIDVVRHPLVARIVDAYDQSARSRAGEESARSRAGEAP